MPGREGREESWVVEATVAVADLCSAVTGSSGLSKEPETGDVSW